MNKDKKLISEQKNIYFIFTSITYLQLYISLVIEFSKLSRSDQRLNLKENYNYQISKTFGKSQRKLSRIELLNRYYYRGRFASFDRKNYQHIFNWEEIEI